MSHDFRIAMSDNILAISYSDNWMEHPDTKTLIKEVNTHVARFEGKPWALFDDIRNWPVKGPKHIEICTDSIADFVELGLTDCIVCAKGLAISHWMMEKIIPKSVNSVYVETVEQAKDWFDEHQYDSSILDCV